LSEAKHLWRSFWRSEKDDPTFFATIIVTATI
jgi:hypothetical protein